MKRQTGICILICILLLVLAGGVYYLFGTKEEITQQEETQGLEEELAKESLLQQEYYTYIIFERDGRLSVFYGDNETLYMETGILAKYLPAEVKERLKVGIRFTSQEELLDFLESYSS